MYFPSSKANSFSFFKVAAGSEAGWWIHGGRNGGGEGKPSSLIWEWMACDPVCFRWWAVDWICHLPVGNFWKQSCKSPSCLHLAVLGSPERFSRLLEPVATRRVLPLLARKFSLTLPYCWRMPGGVVFRGIQEVRNCSPSWSLSEGEDFCVQTLYSWALGWDYPPKCVTPFGLQKGELGWAHLSLQLWNDQEEASGTTKTIFVVWWEKAWFCLVCQEVYLQDFELFITVSSGSWNISKGCPPYFVDRNMDIFGEPLVFNIISQLSNLRVETRVYWVNRCWCFRTFQHRYQPLNGWAFSPCFLF